MILRSIVVDYKRLHGQTGHALGNRLLYSSSSEDIVQGIGVRIDGNGERQKRNTGVLAVSVFEREALLG